MKLDQSNRSELIGTFYAFELRVLLEYAILIFMWLYLDEQDSLNLAFQHNQIHTVELSLINERHWTIKTSRTEVANFYDV